MYVEKSEPICKWNTINTRRILRGIRTEVRKGSLHQAGHNFGRAATSLKKTIERLEALPKPAADESRLTRWFAGLATEAHLLEKLARQLDKGHTKSLARTVLELRHQANVTNNIVLTFGFEFCLLQPARYL